MRSAQTFLPRSRLSLTSNPVAEAVLTEPEGSDLDAARPQVIDEKAEPVPPALQAQIAQIVMEQYSGQFPHPEHMERYAALYPGAPAMIFEQFEKQSEHRRTVESTYMNGNERRANIGQWLAFGIVIVAIGVGLVSVLIGQAVTGGVIVGAAFTGGVVLYIAGGGTKAAAPARTINKNRRAQASATTGSIDTVGPKAEA